MTPPLFVASAGRRKLRGPFRGRYNQSFQPVGLSPTGTSFNGRTPRSGRGYWGSNPYVPARLRSPFGRASSRSAARGRRTGASPQHAKSVSPKADLSFRAPHSIRRAQHLRTSRSIPRACFRIPNSPRWPKTCHCDPHARHWRSICLCPSKRQRSIAALRRPRYGRRRTTWVAQRGAVWLHPSAPTLVDRRIVGVSGRTRRGALREVPQVRFWPRVRDQAFRTIARRRVVARVHRARTAPS